MSFDHGIDIDKLPEVQELHEEVEVLKTFKKNLEKRNQNQYEFCVLQESAISYLEDKLIDALEDADKGWDRARELAVELANSVKIVEKYKNIYEEMNNALKKIGI